LTVAPPEQPMHPRDVMEGWRRAITRVLAPVFLVTWIVLMSYRYVSPDSRDVRARMEHLRAADVVAVEITPYDDSDVEASPTVVVRDRVLVEGFARALSGLPTCWPNHPHVTRTYALKLQLRDRTVNGKLQDSSNDGTCLTVKSGAVGHSWVYAYYRVPRGRGLLPLIDRAVAAAGPGSGPKPH
jgi:hypothetical protein